MWDHHPMQAISRNHPCPCGSGKRYKQCCRDKARAEVQLVLDPTQITFLNLMQRAFWLQRDGNLSNAEVLYREALKIKSNEPDALHMLGIICFKTNRLAEALALISQAIDSSGSRIEAMFSNLGIVLCAALTGSRSGYAAKMRQLYLTWKDERAEKAAQIRPLISVVIPHLENLSGLLASLESVYLQSYLFLEVIVIAIDDREISAALAHCPFKYKLVFTDSQDLSRNINQGVRQTTGEFVSILIAGDIYDPLRIEKMTNGIVCKGGDWGFSALTEKSSGRCPSHFETIPAKDTIGFAILESYNLVNSLSNLFFSRKIFDKLGGFYASTSPLEECFALQALLEAEPIFVDETLCHCAIAPTARPPSVQHFHSTESNTARVRYYEQMGSHPQQANKFAPVEAIWHNHFIYRIAALNHLHLLPKASLRRFVTQAISALESRAVCSLELHPGLDLVSFFSVELGLTESARGIAQSCHTENIPFALRSIDLHVSNPTANRTMDPWLADHCSHAAIVLMFNPDTYKAVIPQLGPNEMRNRYRIGYWYWETEKIPAEWIPALDFIDEIWVATEFVARAVRQFTSKPVLKIRPPINVALTRPYDRAEFDLAEQRFLYLFSFDFGSFSTRKNPYAAIRAFQKAFSLERTDVGLVIKSQGGENRPEKLRELQKQIMGDPRITLIDRTMSRDQVLGLQSICDAFVSLHRSEGLGLGLAECMAQGKPVIGTAYSGNLEFMTNENSCLVDYDLVPIQPGQYLYDQPGVSWAEPNIDHAAWHMKKLFADRTYYQNIATAGQEDILSKWTHQATATAIRQRLIALNLLNL